MHARIEHLLSLRDGEPVAADVSEHVKVCPGCSAELQRLSAIRSELQALPEIEPPAMAWNRISHAVPERSRGLRPRKVGLAAAAVAAITLVTIALIAGHADRRSVESAPKLVETQTPERPAIPHVDELVAQSQHLEQLLRTLPDRPRIERVSTAVTIDTIEQRIQWLDFRLSSVPEEDLSEEQSRQLWRERVQLMDSLVKVRYAEAGGLWF